MLYQGKLYQSNLCKLLYQGNLLSFYIYVLNGVVFNVEQFDDVMLNAIS